MKQNCVTILGFFLTLSFSLLASPNPLGQGLSGNYKLSYIASDLWVRYRDGEDIPTKKVESFDFNQIATPPIPAPIFMLHDPKGPSATIMGGGSDTPRTCQGKNDLLSQHMECTPLSKEVWLDEKTKCGIKKVFIEEIKWSIQDNLLYLRTEAIVLDKNTESECDEYKKNVRADLETGKAPDFFKAMKAAGFIKTGNMLFGDVFFLTHVYQAAETTENAVDLPEGNQTGAYELKYSGESKTRSWNGENKEQLVESKVFNAPDESVQPERLDNILLFHDPKNRSVKLTGAGKNKMRTCELISDKDSNAETYACTIFKANEEEVGTGCNIEHWIQEQITIENKSLPRYQRVEQRHLLPTTKEGCDNYRNKIAEELKDGSAELFFRVLSKTGGIQSTETLGDTFQLVHDYKVTPSN